jgi:4-amino-4-deoxy-L-arabinose transferase-like glycosyltransferase
MTARLSRFPVDLIAVTALALCSRGFYLQWPLADIGDSPEYLALAGHLYQSGVFSYDGVHPTSYRPPLYPAIIAAAQWLTGHPVATVLGLQVVLGALTVTLACLIAADLFGRPTARIAGVMLAIAPMTSRYAAALLTETVFTFFVVSSLAVWLRGRHFASGIQLGLATLTRSSALPYVLLTGVVGVLRPRRFSRRGFVMVFLGAMVTLAPWLARNHADFGRVTVADAGWGVNLLYGTVKLTGGANRWAQLSAAVHAGAADGDALPPSVDGEARARSVALVRIRQHPVLWLETRIRQWPWLLVDSGDYLPLDANRYSFRQALGMRHASTIVVKLGFVAVNVVVVMLAAFGVWASRHRLVELSPFWSFPLFLAAAHIPMYVEPRYGLPLVPFTVIFAAEGIKELSGRIPGSKSRSGGE